MTIEINRDLGRHDAQIEALERDVQALRGEMSRMADKLDEIGQMLSEAKGGWRTLMAVGGMGAAIAAGLMKLLEWATPK